MRDNIVVSVQALYQRAKEILLDGMKEVEVSIIDAQVGSPMCPPVLFFTATDGNGCGVDYDPIDAVERSYTYPESEK